MEVRIIRGIEKFRYRLGAPIEWTGKHPDCERQTAEVRQQDKRDENPQESPLFQPARAEIDQVRNDTGHAFQRMTSVTSL